MDRKKWKRIKVAVKTAVEFILAYLVVTIIFGMDFMSAHFMWFFIPFVIFIVILVLYNLDVEQNKG